MKTKRQNVMLFALLAILMAGLLSPAPVMAQEQPEQHGTLDVGGRGLTGAVDGRQDLQKSMSLPLNTSKLNEYRDLKNGFFVRSFQARFDNIFGTKNYFNAQSHSSLLDDQSWLATFGQYGKFKFQFRYDETPHTFSNTTRSLFAAAGGGAYRLSPAIRNQLWGAANINPTLVTNTYDPSVATAANAVLMPALATATNAVVSADPFMNTAIIRKSGGASITFDPTANWNLSFLFSRERETGTRPLGFLLGSGIEVPEPIDYTTNKYAAGTEYASHRWGFQVGYQGTTFNNGNSVLTADNPFSPAPNTALNLAGQCPTIAAACVTSTANGDIPKTTLNIGGKNYSINSVTGQGKMDLYPNNRADNLSFAAGFDVAKNVRVMASIVPGWASQNDPLLPYTTNLTAGASPPLLDANGSPVTSAHAQKQTLAMNYTITSHPLKHLEVTGRYRSYDYNNNTPLLDLTPVNTDGPVPGTLSHTDNAAWNFFKKNAELTATYFLNKKNSVKAGYEMEIMDREDRDVSHTQENALVAAVDLNPSKDLGLRATYRHSDRSSDAFDYADDDPNYSFAQVADVRRFDEAPRFRNRAEALLTYNPQRLQKFSFSVAAGTTQDNYNRQLNNEAAAGVLGGMGSFYSYGLLKDISSYYSFDTSYAVSNAFSMFAEYTRENYATRMVSRQLGSLVLTCATLVGGVCTKAGPSTAIYDPINDFTTSNQNLVDTWALGMDGDLSKKVSFSTFYSLSAAKGNTMNAGVNCTVGTVACRTNTHWFLDGPVVDANGAILTNPNNPAKDPSGAIIPGVFMPYNATPPVFYGGGPASGNYGLNYPETTTRLHEVVAQLKFKLSANLIPKFEYRYEKFTNVDYQTDINVWSQGMNPYMYMGSAVDPNDSRGTSKYLFLGASSPSYHAHIVSATLEYHF